MKKAIITGCTGFVAKYLARSLLDKGYSVIGTTRNCCPESYSEYGIELHQIDYKNINSWVALFNKFKPNHIYHLAGQSSVKESWEKKLLTFNANLLNTISLLEGVRQCEVVNKVRILTVGSSEEYGHIDFTEAITESTPLQPISPYGISKAAVYMLMRQYTQVYKLNILHARPFNHIGPGQSLGFITSDFASQIASIERGERTPVIDVGNLDSYRDFTDVRDIVEAYIKIMEYGRIGDVYNVCSGLPRSAESILRSFIEMSQAFDSIEIRTDNSKIRPSDYPFYYGSAHKLKTEVGWEPQISFDQSLMDILNYWRSL